MKHSKEKTTNKENKSNKLIYYFLLFCFLMTFAANNNYASYAQDDDLQGLYLKLDESAPFLIQQDLLSSDVSSQLQANLFPNDPLYSEQWHLHQSDNATTINWEAGFQTIELSGIKPKKNTIRVALIDSGINASHPDIQENVDMTSGCSFIQYETCSNAYSDTSTTQHGTGTAGIIAGIVNNETGMAGVSYGINVEITPYKVIQNSGVANYSDIREAFQAILADGNFDVVSINLAGWPNPSSVVSINQLIDQIAQTGTVIVAGSGNDGALNTGVGWPANHPQVIAVGGSNKDGSRRPSSSYGPQLDLSAPAEWIGTLCYENDYCYQSGTSFSGPQVAATVAVIKAYLPDISVEEVKTILQNSAQGEYSEELGYGILDFEAIIKEIILKRKLYLPLLLN